MQLMQALATLMEDEKKDLILELVMVFLASYAGLAAGVSVLVELLKIVWKDTLKPLAPILCVIFTFVLGPVAKYALSDSYGPNNLKGWLLHLVILVFVAVIAAVFHDKFWNAFKGKLGGLVPGGGVDPQPPAEPPKS